MIAGILTLALSLCVLAVVWYLTPILMRVREQQLLRQRCASTHSLVLTDDDGPGGKLTPRVLDLLRTHGDRATFSRVGARAGEHPDIVDQIARGGHELGCHSQTHLNAWKTWPWRVVADVTAAYRALARWIPNHGLFRPPGGKLTPMSWAVLRRRHARIGWWTIDGGDVNENLSGPNSTVEQVKRAGGGVVLLHDFDRGKERADFVLKTTKLLLEVAAQNGWSIRTCGELVRGEQRDAA